MAYAFARSLRQALRSHGMSVAVKGQPAHLQVSTFSAKHSPSQPIGGGDRISKHQSDNEDDSQEMDCSINTSTEDDDLEAEVIESAADDGTEVEVDGPGMRPTASRGIYKAILLGEVGYGPCQKLNKYGHTTTLFSLGTGGMRNNRRPYGTETPEEYAQRSMVQWHRIAVYQEKIGILALKFLQKGSQVYVEGDMETRIFYEPKSGVIKHMNEIAVRQNGRLLFLDQSRNNTALNNKDLSS